MLRYITVFAAAFALMFTLTCLMAVYAHIRATNLGF